jgi:hypothetical protein
MEEKASMLDRAIKLLKGLDIELLKVDYGYGIDYEGNKYSDGTVKITITANTK